MRVGGLSIDQTRPDLNEGRARGTRAVQEVAAVAGDAHPDLLGLGEALWHTPS